MKSTLTRSMLLLLAPALISCAGAKEGQQSERPVLAGVKTVSISTSSVPEFYEAVGTIRSKTTTVISARTMGHVVRVLVSEGDRVRAGQTLAEIDNRDAAVQIRRAEAGESEARESLVVLDKEIAAAESGRAAADANRKLAASTFERYRTLHDRRSVSDQEFDEVQTRLTAATADLDRATAMLESAKARRNQILARIDQATVEKSSADLSMDYSHVVSPVSGIVTARTIEPGMIAAPGVPLMTVEDDAAYRLEAQVPESVFGVIRKGDPVRIVLEAANKAELQGRVSEIVPSADPATRTTIVKVDLPKASSLRSGLFGRAFLAYGERSIISVPRELVVQHGQLTSVYVLDEKIVRQRLIKLGKSLGDRVEVVAGLQNGDLLIVEPREKLTDGMEVRQ
ncbi:MAG TPA: efflux RND transporter periplasmic adaptor subunit [Terriglobia bacterium]|nr:efflux RND transporter periplasmic adaptor subunit [Terriglobia bacterium]